MAKKESRHHHYVPQCYLRNFAVDEQVHVFHSETQKLFKSAVRNVAGERDLYRLEGSYSSQLAEKAFSEIEAHITPILEKIISEQELPLKNSDEFVSLLYFMAILHVRHPDHIENIEASIGRTIKMATEIAAHHIPVEGKTLPDGQFVTRDKAIDAVKAMEEGRIKLHVPRDHGIEAALGSVEKITELLLLREWCLLVAESNSFITSSKPVVLLWDDMALNLKHAVGFGLMGTTVYFPLAPRLMLIGKCVSVKERCIIDSKAVAGVNGIIGFSNPLFLIAQNEDSQMLWGSKLIRFKDLANISSFKK